MALLSKRMYYLVDMRDVKALSHLKDPFLKTGFNGNETISKLVGKQLKLGAKPLITYGSIIDKYHQYQTKYSKYHFKFAKYLRDDESLKQESYLMLTRLFSGKSLYYSSISSSPIIPHMEDKVENFVLGVHYFGNNDVQYGITETVNPSEYLNLNKFKVSKAVFEETGCHIKLKSKLKWKEYFVVTPKRTLIIIRRIILHDKDYVFLDSHEDSYLREEVKKVRLVKLVFKIQILFTSKFITIVDKFIKHRLCNTNEPAIDGLTAIPVQVNERGKKGKFGLWFPKNKKLENRLSKAIRIVGKYHEMLCRTRIGGILVNCNMFEALKVLPYDDYSNFLKMLQTFDKKDAMKKISEFLNQRWINLCKKSKTKLRPKSEIIMLNSPKAVSYFI